MNARIENHLQLVLSHLYINPLEKCNLRCAICYTKKTSPILSKSEIEEFIKRYDQEYKLKTITFCGGEVFTLPYFVGLVNEITDKGIFVQIITNGTVDSLDHFSDPNSVNLIVSLDGLSDYHDANRGVGNFDKSITFLKKALTLGFHTEIFSILTKQNFDNTKVFEKYLQKTLGKDISVTYHPRKPPLYLMHHPISNIVGTVDGFDFLTPAQMKDAFQTKKTFPPKNLGCYQIALVSDGSVYGCCEGTTPIGIITDSIRAFGEKLRERLEMWERVNYAKTCLGCSSPDFVCGIAEYVRL